MAFASAFEQRLLDQGRDEHRLLEDTLDRAWQVAGVLPRRELTMLPEAQLAARYVPAHDLPAAAP